MFGLKAKGKPLLEKTDQHQLSEYITAVAWSSKGILGASSAAGEVLLWKAGEATEILQKSDQSIDCLEFSQDGQFLAASGQDGKVRVWDEKAKLILTLDNCPKWVDQLSWCPNSHLLAFSLSRYVQIWDASTQELLTTLNFADSSVLGLSWHPSGKYLAVCGNLGAKIWDCQDWDNDPYMLETPAASTAIAWSLDGRYLASGNLDLTTTVIEWNQPGNPWVMQGFPGKISHIAWSQSLNGNNPLLATSSAEGIVVWKKKAKNEQGWSPKLLDIHEGKVQGIAFQPQSLLLASIGDDGWLCLWQQAKQLQQVLQEPQDRFSCVAWNPQGDLLATGSQDGGLTIWSKASRAQGF